MSNQKKKGYRSHDEASDKILNKKKMNHMTMPMIKSLTEKDINHMTRPVIKFLTKQDVNHITRPVIKSLTKKDMNLAKNDTNALIESTNHTTN